MVDPQRPSPSKKINQARQTALDLNDLLAEGLEHLDKLVAAKKDPAGKKRMFRRKKLVR